MCLSLTSPSRFLRFATARFAAAAPTLTASPFQAPSVQHRYGKMRHTRRFSNQNKTLLRTQKFSYFLHLFANLQIAWLSAARLSRVCFWCWLNPVFRFIDIAWGSLSFFASNTYWRFTPTSFAAVASPLDKGAGIFSAALLPTFSPGWAGAMEPKTRLRAFRSHSTGTSVNRR